MGDIAAPTPLMDSIAVLYDYGMKPQAIGSRLRCASSTVTTYLKWLSRYWSAETWADACRLHVDSMRGAEGVVDGSNAA